MPGYCRLLPGKKKPFSRRDPSATLFRMKAALRILLRTAHALLLVAGALTLLLAAAQFTPLPWRAFKRLAEVPGLCPREPTHILVMGGSGIPGPSGLMRTFYGAQAAALHPEAELLVAMPLGAGESVASRAYLDELRLRGVPADRMRILPEGRNTREQALRLAGFLGEAATRAVVLIVTDPEHVRRTAASLRGAGIRHLAAMPAHPLSIEDPLPWQAAELEPASCSERAEACAPARQTFVPDIGSSLHLRYDIWNHLRYTQDALREHAALSYYRLQGWTGPAEPCGDPP
jgi:uncharacterized SAM-binding protein YcdF (DUF218 family)